jgi:hypothetical protein
MLRLARDVMELLEAVAGDGARRGVLRLVGARRREVSRRHTIRRELAEEIVRDAFARRPIIVITGGLIGAVIPTLDHAIYASMVDSLQARLAERHVSMIPSTSMYDRGLEFEQVRLLIERGAEALILVGAHKTA